MGSVVPAGNDPRAGLPADYSAAGFSHCPAANDERFRIAVQRYFDSLCDLGLGVSDGVSGTGKCVRAIPDAGRGRVALLSGDESANGPPGAETRAQAATTGRD